MGIYAQYVLPRVIDLAMRNPETTRLRAAWIPHARGEVERSSADKQRNRKMDELYMLCVLRQKNCSPIERICHTQVASRRYRLSLFPSSHY
jgi:hypothetical protein